MTDQRGTTLPTDADGEVEGTEQVQAPQQAPMSDDASGQDDEAPASEKEAAAQLGDFA